MPLSPITLSSETGWVDFGASVALSFDGTIMAVGKKGGVLIYNDQQQLQYNISTQIDYRSVIDLSYDGNVLAVAPYGSRVLIYEGPEFNLPSTITPRGGEATDTDLFVSLSDNGDILAVGSPMHGGDSQITIYTKISGTWVQKGSVISDSGYHGQSVSLSANGSIVAIGGTVFTNVYEFKNGDWTKIGDNIVGKGHSVSLSADGSTVVVGDYSKEGYVGGADVYTLENNQWVRLGNEIKGEVQYGSFGWSTCISRDGKKIFVGSNPPYGEAKCSVYDYGGTSWLVESEFEGKVSSASFSGDGTILLVGEQYHQHYLSQARIFSLYTTSSVGGDPYIRTITGHTVKLPDTTDNYRLIQDEEIIVNALVDKRQVNITDENKSIPGLYIHDSGYFVTKLFVRTKENQIHIDVTNPLTFLRPDLSWETNNIERGYSSENPIIGEYISRSLELSNNVKLEIRLFKNPQVVNDLVFRCKRHKSTMDGVLVKHYRPKLWKIGRIDDTRPKRIKHKRQLINKTTLNLKSECYDSVHHMELFNAMYR